MEEGASEALGDGGGKKGRWGWRFWWIVVLVVGGVLLYTLFPLINSHFFTCTPEVTFATLTKEIEKAKEEERLKILSALQENEEEEEDDDDGRYRRPLNWCWGGYTGDNDLTEKDFMLKVLAPRNRRAVARLGVRWMNDSIGVHGIGEFDTPKLLTDLPSLDNIGVFHIGDEYNHLRKNFYQHYDYVIRNYYFDKISIGGKDYKMKALGSHSCGNEEMITFDKPLPPPFPPLGVWWVINGWRSGLGELPISQLPLATDREITCSFVGSLRGSRGLMVNLFKDFPRAKIVVEASFLGSMGLFRYGSIVRASIFTLCPHGNNAETIRLADALESGSIPVVEDAPYLKAFPEPPPFVVIKAWNTGALARLHRLLNNSTGLLNLQRDNILWWHRYKNCARRDLEKILDSAFATRPQQSSTES